MGFDLYGLKPQENTNEPPILLKFQDKDGWVEWDIMSDSDKEEYFAEKETYNEDNPGIYFRNNVWWWRPLWNYVCKNCSDILTDEDVGAGSFNDGHRISKTKSKRIAARLRKLLKNGAVDIEETAYQKEQKSKQSHYPFEKINIIEFERFCEQSGGFEIC